jgi:hypothetical protein
MEGNGLRRWFGDQIKGPLAAARLTAYGPSRRFRPSAHFRCWRKLPWRRTSRNRTECRVGPGNFTPSPSQNPDLNLSIHPARVTARRLRAANVFGGISSPSGVRKAPRRAAAAFSFGLKLRMPSRTNAALTRVIIRLASPTSVSRSRLGTSAYLRYNQAAILDPSPLLTNATLRSPALRPVGGPSVDGPGRHDAKAHEARQHFSENKEQSIALIRKAISTLEKSPMRNRS